MMKLQPPKVRVSLIVEIEIETNFGEGWTLDGIFTESARIGRGRIETVLRVSEYAGKIAIIGTPKIEAVLVSQKEQ